MHNKVQQSLRSDVKLATSRQVCRRCARRYAAFDTSRPLTLGNRKNNV